MTMISWNLGRDYIAWDKAVQIEFRKPGRGTLYSTDRIDAAVHAAAERRAVVAARLPVERQLDAHFAEVGRDLGREGSRTRDVKVCFVVHVF